MQCEKFYVGRTSSENGNAAILHKIGTSAPIRKALVKLLEWIVLNASGAGHNLRFGNGVVVMASELSELNVALFAWASPQQRRELRDASRNFALKKYFTIEWWLATNSTQRMNCEKRQFD